jgi:hypothetical protein
MLGHSGSPSFQRSADERSSQRVPGRSGRRTEPAGHRQVDELLEQLADVVGDHEWVVRFAKARKAEVDVGSADVSTITDPGRMLTKQELEGLTAGFMTIRDQEPLDDVADWANAVVALLEDEAAHSG